MTFITVVPEGPCQRPLQCRWRGDRARSSWSPGWVASLPIPGEHPQRGTPASHKSCERLPLSSSPPTLAGASLDTCPLPAVSPAPPHAPPPLALILWLVRLQTAPASASPSGNGPLRCFPEACGEHSVSGGPLSAVQTGPTSRPPIATRLPHADSWPHPPSRSPPWHSSAPCCPHPALSPQEPPGLRCSDSRAARC